jgi:hypothetical protein
MPNMRRTTATIGAAALVATPLTLLTAAPASAAEKEFGIGGADIHFEVEKDDGRFEVELDIDDARPGSRWRVTLWHDGTIALRGQVITKITRTTFSVVQDMDGTRKSLRKPFE